MLIVRPMNTKCFIIRERRMYYLNLDGVIGPDVLQEVRHHDMAIVLHIPRDHAKNVNLV